jgi:glycosyltransferase involved in cell wall biosynthesis
MNKQTLVFQGPLFCRAGYGSHGRDLLRSLKQLDKYDIKIVPLRWGNTPQNYSDDVEFTNWMLERVVTKLDKKPDIFIQLSVANEFKPIGEYNIGITAGVETNIIPKDFIDGSNKMDLIIVPSNFTKQIMEKVVYQEKNNQTGQIVAEHRITKPIEVLFEGVDTSLFNKLDKPTSILSDVETSFNFLIVGHWLRGDLGEDRKDIGMSIKTISTVFKYLPKEKRPGIIIKTSQAGFSVMDREYIIEKIHNILGTIDVPIYFVHGDLSESEMNELYNSDKVKVMVSFTKGEGYGRPLSEFAVTGKPVIVSDWSGQTDFLPKEYTVYLSGEVKNVHESAVDGKFILKEAKWFTVNYSDAANKIYSVFNEYDTYLSKSKGLTKHINENFSLNKMTEVFDDILLKYVKKNPTILPLNLPKLNKVELPKLQKV